MNSKEIKIQHFLVASVRIVQYWNKCVILSFFPFRFTIEMEHLLVFLKNRNKIKAKGIFSNELQNEMERFLLFQKMGTKPKQKELTLYISELNGTFTFIPVKN
jgi:hypothetical protein